MIFEDSQDAAIIDPGERETPDQARTSSLYAHYASIASNAATAHAVEDRAHLPPERATFQIASGDLGALLGQLAYARQAAVLIGTALGALGIAAFVCDGRAVVRALTPPAQAALASGRIRLVNGRLSAPPPYGSADMEAAIAAASSHDLDASAPATQTIVNRNFQEPGAVQVIDVIALPRPPAPSGFEPRAVVVLRGGPQDRADLQPILTRAFGLTPAEAQVAARMANGQPRETIAAERGASLQTVRSQIKSIFAKLNVTRERELVALLAKITQR